MSVILDALHKARSDNRKNKVEQHPNSVARVLEPGAVPGMAADSVSKHRRGWALPVVIVLGGMCFLALVGGAFFLLYDQISRLNVSNNAASITQPKPAVHAAEATLTAPAAVNPNATAAPVAGLPPVSLPPPVPVSELPVQPPATNAAVPAIDVSTQNAPVQGNVAAFKLGSIVCEGEDCIAHLNGRTIRTGDQVKNYRVKQITATTVVLQGATPADSISLSLFD